MTRVSGWQRWWPMATAAMAASTLAPRAEPCSCVLVPIVAEVSPGPLTEAPRNARVTAALPRGWRRWGACFGEVAGASCVEGDYALELRQASGGGAVAAEQVESPSVDAWAWDQPTVRVVLSPKAELAPGARHELWVVPRGSSGRAMLLGTFRTGAASDAAAPTFGGVLSGGYEGARAPSFSSSGKPIVTVSSCGETPAIELEVGAIADESEARYHVWQAPPGSSIDYAKPPDAIFRAPSASSGQAARLSLQRRVACGGPTFLVPDAPSVKLGVKAVDVAGNASAPGEIEIRLIPSGSKPGKGKGKGRGRR